MTDETDIRSNDADSGRSTDEKLEAEVIATSGPAGDPNVYLVEYPDGEQVYEPATPKNVALFEDGLYNRVNGNNEFTISVGADSLDVELNADVENDYYVITVDDDHLPVPSDRVEDVIRSFDGATGAVVGSRLYNIYSDVLEGQVRRSVVDQFSDRFPIDRVKITPDGWVVDDTFVVTYEATNHLIDIEPTDPYGGEVDESTQAVYLDIDATESREIVTPDGETVEVSPLEQEFLTTVEGLLFPEDYFGVELVDEIQQHKDSADEIEDVIEGLTANAEVIGFTDSKTGIHHGSSNHDFRKHDVRDLNVTEDVRDKLWSNPYDHAGVHELLLRRQEFVNNPDIEVFRDADDDDTWKWNEIEKTSENAPIPDDVRRKLNDMFQ